MATILDSQVIEHFHHHKKSHWMALVYSTGQLTHSIKDQGVTILAFVDHIVLLQWLNSAIVARKQSWMIRK